MTEAEDMLGILGLVVSVWAKERREWSQVPEKMVSSSAEL